MGKIKQSITAIADVMEVKLELNDYKGGWDDMSFADLHKRFKDTQENLEAAICFSESTERVQEEIIDCMNLLMMMYEQASEFDGKEAEPGAYDIDDEEFIDDDDDFYEDDEEM